MKKISDKEKIKQAIDLCFQYGPIDGGHHKMWVIDQVLRILLQDKYKEEIEKYEHFYDEETNEEYYYEWDCGIAP
jgi:hypothetical protein